MLNQNFTLAFLLIFQCLYVRQTHCTFTNACGYSHSDFVDPIVAFGQKASHLHDLFASTRITETTTVDDLLNSTCSTCRVQGDKSAYWSPSVYYIHENGSESRMTVNMAAVYYLFDNKRNETINPMPNGLKMVVGNPKAPGPEKDPLFEVRMTKKPNFNQEGGHEVFTSKGFPEKGQDMQMIRFEVFTPPCMKAKDILDSDDHFSHLAYPDKKTYKCPPSHPYRIPSVQFHPVFFLPKPTSWNSLQELPLRLSTTPVRGNMYQWHIDVFAAWEPDAMKTLVNKCLNSTSTGCDHGLKADFALTEKCIAKVRELSPKSTDPVINAMPRPK